MNENEKKRKAEYINEHNFIVSCSFASQYVYKYWNIAIESSKDDKYLKNKMFHITIFEANKTNSSQLQKRMLC